MKVFSILRSRLRSGASLRGIVHEICYFLRDSTPERRRARFGDLDYDFDHDVNTTASNVPTSTRLTGAIAGGGYQPTDPDLFRRLLDLLAVDFSRFTFIDIGSGKGRALLLASDYPFRRIIGVELLPELHAIAQQNIAHYHSDSQRCFAIEAVRQDARDFEFPPEPLVLYFFNPLPEEALAALLTRLSASLAATLRDCYVLYATPNLEYLLSTSPRWTRLSGNEQYAIYRFSSALATGD